MSIYLEAMILAQMATRRLMEQSSHLDCHSEVSVGDTTISFEVRRHNIAHLKHIDIGGNPDWYDAGVIGAEAFGAEEIVILLHSSASKKYAKNPTKFWQVVFELLSHEFVHVRQFELSAGKLPFGDASDEAYFEDKHEIVAFISDIIHTASRNAVQPVDTARYSHCTEAMSVASLNRLHVKLFKALADTEYVEALKVVYAKRFIHP